MKHLIVIFVCIICGISQGFSQTSASIASPTFVTNAVKRIIKATNNVFLITNIDGTISIGATNSGGGSATNVLFNNSQFASNASSQVYIKSGATITNANFAGATSNNTVYATNSIVSGQGSLISSNGNVLAGTNGYLGFNSGGLSSGMWFDNNTLAPYKQSLYFLSTLGNEALIFATNGNVFPLNITAALGDLAYPWGPFYITPGGTTNVGSLMVRGTNNQWYSSTSVSNISLNVTNVTLSLNAITNIQQNISSNWNFSIYLTNGATVYSNGVALGGGGGSGAYVANSAGIATNVLITNATLQGRITNVATMVNTNNGTFYGGQNFYAGSYVSFNGEKNKGLGLGLNQGYVGSYGNYAWSEADATRLSIFDVGYSGTSNILIELGSIGNYKGAGWPDAPALLRVGADLYIAKAETTNYNTNLLANLTARRMAADEFGSVNFSITGNLITNALIRYALTNISGISRAQSLPHVWLTNVNGGYTIQETNLLTLSSVNLSNSLYFFSQTSTGTNIFTGFFDTTNIASTNGFSNNATIGNVAQTNFFNSLVISNTYLVAQATTNGGSTLTNYFTNNNQLRLVGGLVLTNIDNNFTNRSRSNLGTALIELNVPVSAGTNPVVSVWTNNTMQMAIRGNGSILLPNTTGTRSLEFQNPSGGTLYMAPSGTDVLTVYNYDVAMANFNSGYVIATFNAGTTGFGFLNANTGFYSPVSGGAGIINARTNLFVHQTLTVTNAINIASNSVATGPNVTNIVGYGTLFNSNGTLYWRAVISAGTTNDYKVGGP